jgi:hypothetical protein
MADRRARLIAVSYTRIHIIINVIIIITTTTSTIVSLKVTDADPY